MKVLYIVIFLAFVAEKTSSVGSELPRGGQKLPRTKNVPGDDFSHLETLHNEDEDIEDDEAEGEEDEEDYEWLDNKNTFNIHPEIPFDKKKPRKDGQEDHETTLRWWETVATKHPGNTFDGFGATTASPSKEMNKIVDHLPVFVLHPVDAFIIRGKPAILNCKVIGADKAHFTCNGEAMDAADRHREEDNMQMIEDNLSMVKHLTIEISRTQVEEFFGQFTCRCEAWSPMGMSSSSNATIEMAYLRKEFEVPPYSQSVELRSQIELRCHPPKGVPKPRIYWLKDRVEVQPERDSNYIQASDGHLIIIQAREKDQANYTCVAENVANRRLSPPARLGIHVTGGWSEWSEWSGCSLTCGGGFQLRDRVCDNPSPMWGGATCEGPSMQKNKCSNICPAVTGGWSSWSSWSTCNLYCVRHRRRVCNNPQPAHGGLPCRGQDHAIDPCTGGMCRQKRQVIDKKTTDEAQEILETDFSLLIGLSVALAVFLAVTITSIRLLRKKGHSPSMQTMTNLNYRCEFSNDKKDREGGNLSSTKVETKFINVMSRDRISATNPVDIIYNQPGSQGFDNSDKKTPPSLAKFGPYDVVLAGSARTSIPGSPYVVTKSNGNGKFFGGIGSRGGVRGSKALLLFGGSAASPSISVRSTGLPVDNTNAILASSTPRLQPKGHISPTCSEHQYDIPFGHLNQEDHLTTHLTPQSHYQRSRCKLPSAEPDQYQMESRALRKSRNPKSVDDRQRPLVGNKVDLMNNIWTDQRFDGTLLQPRLIDASTGKPHLLGRWSGSDKSVNTSSYSESDRPVSSLFDGESGLVSAKEALTDASSYRQSLTSCFIDPESFTFSSVGCTGGTVSLTDLGVSLCVPEGALDRGYTEEIFLAVMTDGRDHPRLLDNQTLLSPVILVGPPRLTFQKPVVLSFEHRVEVASLPSWEIAVYHCDSLFSAGEDTSWVKLASVGEGQQPLESMATMSSKSSSPSSSEASSKSSKKSHCSSKVLVHIERERCYIMTEFLSRFCLVGQPVTPPPSAKQLVTTSAYSPKQ